LDVAVIVVMLEEETARVVILKVAVLFPAATVTEVGTVADVVSLLDSNTVMPPAGAVPDKVIVPCEVVPPVTEVGLKLKEINFGGLTVSVAVWAVPL
jgi:hypothetical protein